ncbi:MAG: pantetheine-phosphate adenylyltransferase [Bulleidia sp.]|nr:pantetheine-phosphate adenylyltransferase [Bulleidia sp.]
MKAVYSGTFDPVTNGHMDIIQRASKIFDEVIVLIMRNPNKHCLFQEEERKRLIELSVQASHLENVTVVIGTGLTVDMAKSLDANVIIRGIRAVSDYEYELMQATANMMLNSSIETMLMIARPEYSFLSSSVVKEIALNHGNIENMVPDVIVKEVQDRMSKYY